MSSEFDHDTLIISLLKPGVSVRLSGWQYWTTVREIQDDIVLLCPNPNRVTRINVSYIMLTRWNVSLQVVVDETSITMLELSVHSGYPPNIVHHSALVNEYRY